MTELSKPENQVTRVNESGEVVQEPGYVEFLRNEGFTIESVAESHSVPSESNPGKSYNVLKLVTYKHPKDHPELDFVEDEIEITVCSCWDWRNNSNDVREGEVPGGDCKHCRDVFREERAKSDENQERLVE